MNKSNQSLMSLVKNDEWLFKFTTGLKFVVLSALFMLIVLMTNYILLKIDLIFFQSHHYQLTLDNPDWFFDFIYSNLLSQLPAILVVMILIFLGGYYVAVIMIRPFKSIGQCCEDKMKGQVHFYKPEMFADLKLLTSFSTYFFQKIDESKLNKKIKKAEIPEDYTKIHKPIWEFNFFLNYFFLIIILTLMATLGIQYLSQETKERVLIFSTKISKSNPDAKVFIERQLEVADTVIISLLWIHIATMVVFGMHLYQKIATPAFAVFATLRSFLKGNFHTRIHLVGFYYLRNDCRKINKYLDYIQKDLTE